MIYKIADLYVEMETWGKTLHKAEPYRVEHDGFDVQIESECEELYKKYPQFPLESHEYMGSASSFYRQLLRYDGMMIHASAVMMDGYAYLFSANSGTGKSTHTGLWQRVFGEDRAKILNDDKPAVRLRGDTVYAYGTPWSGKTDLNINASVPLAGICMLERGEKNCIEPCSGSDAIFALYKQTVRPSDPQLAALVLENLDKVLKRVPVWRLRCNMEPEAAMVSYEAMRPKCE